MGWLQKLRPGRPQRAAPVAEAMEARLLYSADIAAGLLLGASADTGAEQRTLTGTGEYASTASAPATASASTACHPAAA